MSNILQKHYKFSFPALNVHNPNEPITTDTIYSDIHAIENDSKFSQILCAQNYWLQMSME